MKELSLYVHIPFCKEKCYYCDFPSFAKGEENYENYVETLIQEIENKHSLCTDYIVKTVFFGGGTPTVLKVDLLEKIMNSIFCNFHLHQNAEITIEANPATFDLEKVIKLREIGFNRISMGVQAWQNNLLKDLGRLHTIENFIENYYAVRQGGFTNVNVDLMFALPKQNFVMWQETLQNIVKLSPEHISVYSLIIEEDTIFHHKLEKGEIHLMDEDLDREMYHFAIDFLAENGYSQYEISNFAKENFVCQHNDVYWTMKEYLGIGLSSHSYFNGERFNNTYDLASYLNSKGDFETIRENIEFIKLEDEMSEFMFLGLRRNKGIDLSEFEKRYNKTIEQVYPNVIEKLIKDGLMLKSINKEETRIFLTKKGFDLSNIVFEKFV